MFVYNISKAAALLLALQLAEEVGHLLPLPLTAEVGAELPLAQLKSTLVPANLEQFHNTLLIRSLASNLANYVAHEGNALTSTLQRKRKRELIMWAL